MKCCAAGQVNLEQQLEQLSQSPIEYEFLKDERVGQGEAKHFLRHIQRYNNELAFGTTQMNHVGYLLYKNYMFFFIYIFI